MSATPLPIRSDRKPLVDAHAIEHHVADLSVTVGAEVRLGELRTRLTQNNQWLPIDGDDSLPVGRAVGLNSTGPLRLGYGAWRDLLLGTQFINHRGELITAGGRTVKNVAGYDLTKLMVGQGGELGQIVTITTRTYRLPTHALLARFDAGLNVGDLLPTPLRPQWAILTHDSLQCGYLGDERTVAHIQKQLAQINPVMVASRSVEQDISDRAAQWGWPEQGMARLTVPPANLRKITTEFAPDAWIADPVFGVILLRNAAAQPISHRGTIFMDGRLIPLGLTEAEAQLAERIRAAMRN